MRSSPFPSSLLISSLLCDWWMGREGRWRIGKHVDACLKLYPSKLNPITLCKEMLPKGVVKLGSPSKVQGEHKHVYLPTSYYWERFLSWLYRSCWTNGLSQYKLWLFILYSIYIPLFNLTQWEVVKVAIKLLPTFLYGQQPYLNGRRHAWHAEGLKFNI